MPIERKAAKYVELSRIPSTVVDYVARSPCYFLAIIIVPTEIVTVRQKKLHTAILAYYCIIDII